MILVSLKITWEHNNLMRGNRIENLQVASSSGEDIHLIYFHDCICESNHQDKKVKEIILPNNMLIHIFAIKIEN